MDDYRQQQIDVLKEAVPYSEKLIGAIEKVSDELAGVPFPETHDAVNVIIEGLNWLFEVYNGTKDMGQLTRQKLILALRSFQKL